jgi:hypothetical protein
MDFSQICFANKKYVLFGESPDGIILQDLIECGQ